MDTVWQHFINTQHLPNTNSKSCKEKALVENYGKEDISSPAKAMWGLTGSYNVIMAWSFAWAGE